MKVNYSQHSAQRAAQRNLSPGEIEYVLWYGRRFNKAGALIYYLRRRDIPDFDQANSRWARLAGTAVVLAKDGRTLITVWRNRRHGLKRIRRKPRERRQPWLAEEVMRDL